MHRCFKNVARCTFVWLKMSIAALIIAILEAKPAINAARSQFLSLSFLSPYKNCGWKKRINSVLWIDFATPGNRYQIRLVLWRYHYSCFCVTTFVRTNAIKWIQLNSSMLFTVSALFFVWTFDTLFIFSSLMEIVTAINDPNEWFAIDKLFICHDSWKINQWTQQILTL